MRVVYMRYVFTVFTVFIVCCHKKIVVGEKEAIKKNLVISGKCWQNAICDNTTHIEISAPQNNCTVIIVKISTLNILMDALYMEHSSCFSLLVMPHCLLLILNNVIISLQSSKRCTKAHQCLLLEMSVDK